MPLVFEAPIERPLMSHYGNAHPSMAELTHHKYTKLMNITKEQLKSIAPISDAGAETFLPHIIKNMGDVNTPLRFAAFLANLLHESGCFRYVRELASGDAYEGRKSLGNTHKGDGRLFKGRGLIQVTGRNNYLACSKALFGDDRLIRNPELLASPEYAVKSAYWFWNSRNLNELADTPDFRMIVKRINGGYNGFSERKKYYDALLVILSHAA